MKTQLLQDLQESGSTPLAAGEAMPPPSQPRRKPVVLADETRTPSIPPPPTAAVPADEAHTPPEPPRRPAVWHGPAAQRVDAGTPGQRLGPRTARRAPDVAARGTGVAIEAWAERAALAGAGESRPAPAPQQGGAPGPERPTMDVAAFFGRDERRSASHPAGPQTAAVEPARAATSGDSTPALPATPAPRTAPAGTTQGDALAGAAAVPRRPDPSDVPAGLAERESGIGPVPPPVAAPGGDAQAPVSARPADGSAPGIPVHGHVPAVQSNASVRPQGVEPDRAARQLPTARPDDTTLLRAPADERGPAAQWSATPRASAPDPRTEPMPERVASPVRAAADTPVSPWRRLWKRRVVAWSAAGALAAGVGGGAGWLYAGSRAESVPVAANTAQATATRGAQAYAAREPAPTVKAPPTASAPEPAQAPTPSSAAPIDAVKPPPPAEPEVKPAPPAPAPAVTPAAPRSVATVDLDAPKRAARHAAAARRRAAEKARRDATPEVRPAKAEPSPRERREETLMQCRAHGYDERQCIRRGCAMTRYGFACRG
ncbi:hypothetical protein HAV22_11605 [Massilia sp. TW-1]|uniref:Meckel syndrome type 1 protein n=1 Tax=Telluria antibiotica TaxID=2717319 RepID=A0ABX0PAE3_9BURK|nr:hypothetical protein [Telluria antibiotica]NIA54277.1 hypothetical protein [Telluria antibiotica]